MFLNIEDIKAGISQGSNLSPFPFLLHKNDLQNHGLDSSVPTLSADDTNITISGVSASEIQNKLERELHEFHM